MFLVLLLGLITASYPDVSLRCARKGRREGDNGRDGTSPAVCTLPMVPCGSSPVTRVSRSPLPCEKRSAWGGGWFNYIFGYGAKYISRQDRFGTRETRFVDHLYGITKLSIILRSERLRLKRSVILLRQLYRGSSRKRTPSGNEKNVRNWSCRQLTRVSVRKASTEFVNSKHKYLSIVNLH